MQVYSIIKRKLNPRRKVAYRHTTKFLTMPIMHQIINNIS